MPPAPRRRERRRRPRLPPSHPARPRSDRARRPWSVASSSARQPRRTVAGRAVPPVPASVRDPDQTTSSKPHPQLVPGDRPGHRPSRQTVARRGRAAEAAGARRRLGPGRVRRGAQAVGDVLARARRLSRLRLVCFVTRCPSYALTDSDVGATIKVRASFTDDAGNDEELTSVAPRRRSSQAFGWTRDARIDAGDVSGSRRARAPWVPSSG